MASQILFFPIQKASADVVLQDDFYGAFQNKLEGAQMLNEVAAGHYLLSPGNIRALEITNQLCQAFGLTPLDFRLPN